MAIYTRTGDKGKTRLGTGQRVSKDSLRVDAYGTIDELNSLLGVIYSELGRKRYHKYFYMLILYIQSDLFCIGAYLANPKMLSMIEHFEKRIKRFEQEIDFMMGKTPPLKNFIFPQGGRVGSLFQLARTISRRAERKIVTLSKKTASAKGSGESKEKIDERVLSYINRLSDLLLACARYANFRDNKKEIIWSREKYIK